MARSAASGSPDATASMIARCSVTLFLGRLVEGFGYPALAVGAVTLIMRTTDAHRRHAAMGLWASHTAVAVGVTFSVVVPLARAR
jgi:MFS family permease